MYLVEEAVVTAGSLPGLGLGASNTGSGEGERAVKETVVLETSTAEESMVGVESLSTGEGSNVWTERKDRYISEWMDEGREGEREGGKGKEREAGEHH